MKNKTFIVISHTLYYLLPNQYLNVSVFFLIFYNEPPIFVGNFVLIIRFLIKTKKSVNYEDLL